MPFRPIRAQRQFGNATVAAPVTGNLEERNYNQYRSSLFDKFNGLLKEPKTPIVAPPKVMRVLLLPYTGQENEFYMLRYVYFFVDKPRWILGDSVTADGEDECRGITCEIFGGAEAGPAIDDIVSMAERDKLGTFFPWVAL